jgi:hypothetical protein
MMKKIAFFVEGQTEVIFISEMIRQVFNEKETNIVVQNTTNYKMNVNTIKTDTDKEYYFLLYNCGSDDKVKSNIKDNYQKLQQANFIHIIGLQDLFNPQRKKKGIDDNKFQKTINVDIPQAIPARIYFAIQEIEAWFIAEETHYQRISPILSLEKVNSITGIDIQKDDTEKIPHPTVIIDKIYKAGGRKNGYSKNEYVIKDVVSKLDFNNLYLAVRNRNRSLNELLTCLDGLIP